MPTLLESIVDHYITHVLPLAEKELDFFCNQLSLQQAIINAALAKDDRGKRLQHQWRLPQPLLQKSCDALIRILPAFNNLTDFEQLHSLVQQTSQGIRGLGELYVYDTAFRIGAFLGIWPMRVYLHRGTRQGARVLGYKGASPLKPSDLPMEFQRIPAHQIEDILCIYRDHFVGGSVEALLDCYPRKIRFDCQRPRKRC